MFRENALKKDLAEGKVVCGYAVMSRSPVIVEMLGFSGFDWLFIDTEHAPIYSDMVLENLIRAAEASNVVPVVRVKENREQYIRNALEAGAMGVEIEEVDVVQFRWLEFVIEFVDDGRGAGAGRIAKGKIHRLHHRKPAPGIGKQAHAHV